MSGVTMPRGWKAMPGEPTWETLIAGRDALMDTDDEIDLSTDQIRDAYRAMFAISPPPASNGAASIDQEAIAQVILKVISHLTDGGFTTTDAAKEIAALMTKGASGEVA